MGAIEGWLYSRKRPFKEVIIKQIPISSKELTPEKSYIIGVLCGDGWISTNYRIGLSVCDKEFADYFQYCIEKVYAVKCSRSIRTRKKNNFTKNPKTQYIVSLCSKLVVKDLQKYSKSFKTFKWAVPEQIKNSKEITAEFIKGFADSEAHVRFRKGHSEINLCSGNLLALKQLKNLLENTFQIYSYLGDNGQGVPVIVITRYVCLNRFYNKIGLIVKRKQIALKNALSSYKRKGIRRYSTEFKIRAIDMLKNGMKHREIAKLFGTSHSNIYDWEKQFSNSST